MYRQLVPNDDHDWDLTQVSPLFSARVDGQERRLIATAGKDGLLRLLDRNSHEVLWEAAVTTRKNFEARITTEPQLVCPGVLGGVEWNGPALLPDPGVLIVPAVDWCSNYAAAEEVRYVRGQGYMGGTAARVEERSGWLTALNVADGSERWKYHSPEPMIAAVTTTASGLVLTGELTGDFLVFDGRTGEELYRHDTGAPMGGGVISYAVDGRQYVAAASGRPSAFWMQERPGSTRVTVFGLPRR